MFQSWVKQATFVMEHHFYFEKQQKDKSWLFRLGYLADIVLEINRVSPLFQGKQLIFFLLWLRLNFQEKIVRSHFVMSNSLWHRGP